MIFVGIYEMASYFTTFTSMVNIAFLSFPLLSISRIQNLWAYFCLKFPLRFVWLWTKYVLISLFCLNWWTVAKVIKVLRWQSRNWKFLRIFYRYMIFDVTSSFFVTVFLCWREICSDEFALVTVWWIYKNS